MSCGVGLIDLALFLVTGSKAFSCQGLEQPAKPEEGKSKASFHIWCWGQDFGLVQGGITSVRTHVLQARTRLY